MPDNSLHLSQSFTSRASASSWQCEVCQFIPSYQSNDSRTASECSSVEPADVNINVSVVPYLRKWISSRSWKARFCWGAGAAGRPASSLIVLRLVGSIDCIVMLICWLFMSYPMDFMLKFLAWAKLTLELDQGNWRRFLLLCFPGKVMNVTKTLKFNRFVSYSID